MKFCLTACQTSVAAKNMFKGLIVNPLLIKSINMFERMEILEYIYEGVVELSYKKSTRADTNCAGLSRKMRG